VYIHQLGRKLGETTIVAVHGYGYRIGEARLSQQAFYLYVYIRSRI
jgi:hypothetical protein